MRRPLASTVGTDASPLRARSPVPGPRTEGPLTGGFRPGPVRRRNVVKNSFDYIGPAEGEASRSIPWVSRVPAGAAGPAGPGARAAGAAPPGSNHGGN